MRTPSASTAAQAAGLADDYRRIRQTTRILAEPPNAKDVVLHPVSGHVRPPCRLFRATDTRWQFAAIQLTKDTDES